MNAANLGGFFVFLILSKYNALCDDTDSSNKIDPDVNKSFENGDNPNLVVDCKPPPPSQDSLEDPIPIDQLLRKTMALPGFKNKAERDNLLTNTLQNAVSSLLNSLSPLTDILDESNVDYSFIWLSGQLVIYQLPLALLNKLAASSVVVWIRLDKVISPASTFKPVPRSPPTGNSTWNLGLIDARCGNITCFGKGVKIGIIDTGVMYNHTELVKNWAGQPYGWWNGTGPNTSTAFPEDKDGRGTQTIGLAVGKNIGVAPDATWMACQACAPDSSGCTQAAYLLCAQYMACPWQWNDTSPNRKTMNCTYRPDIVIYSAATNVGGQLFDQSLFWFYKSIENLHSKGIVTVASMGDNGPYCNVGSTPAIHDIELAVGAVDQTVTIWDSSSRGPVITNVTFTANTTAARTCPKFSGDQEQCMGTGKNEKVCTMIKPDIVAPGVNLTTSTTTSTTAYAVVSGTGFAAAEVAGIIALMICSNRNVTWDYKLAYQVLTKSADISMIDLKNGSKGSPQQFVVSSHLFCDLILSGICKGFPNNLYGYGLAYACGAVMAAKSLKN